MSFSDTYQAEVLQSRRTRSQRAQFWAKIIGFALMITVAATLRSEPELRQAILTKGMDGVMALNGKSAPVPVEQSGGLPSGTQHAANGQMPNLSQMPDLSQIPGLADMPQLAQLQAMVTPTAAAQPETQIASRPRDAVKVNRFGSSQTSQARFQSAPKVRGLTAASLNTAPSTKAAAVDVGALLQAMKPGQ